MSESRSGAVPLREGGSTVERDFAAITDTYAGDVDDVHSMYRELRRTMPVMEGDILARYGVPSQADYSGLGRKVYTLFKYEDVSAVLRDPVTYTSGLLNEGLGQFFDGFLVTAMDGDAHKLARNLLAPAFSPGAVAKWRELVKDVASRELIGPLSAAKRCDLIADVLLPAPIRLIYEILGFPKDPEQIEQFATWAMRILVGPQRDPEKAKTTMQIAFQAAREIHEHVMKIVAVQRAAGAEGSGLIGHLLRASSGGRTLSNEEISSFIRQLLPAAAETTTRSFGSILVALLERPALLARVRADRSLIPKVIDEGMRWETAATFLARQCAKDVEIRGVKIPAGTALSLACGSAGRDEDVFDNPDEFNIDRPRKPHMGFGYGAHLCLGMMVARMEMDCLLNAMLDAWPGLRLDPQAPRPKIVGIQLRGPRAVHVVWD